MPYRICPLFFGLWLAVFSNHVLGLDEFLDTETAELPSTYDKRLRYTPSTVVIFDRDYIYNSGVLTVAELLERVIGIHLTRKAYGASSNQYIRGIDSNLLILHNGVENAKLIPELLAMPVVDLDRVEVLKGSHYPLYGASAVVGTINLVTSGIRTDTANVGVRAGTSDTGQFWATKSDRTDNIGYSAYISHTKTETTKGIIQSDVQSFIDQGFGTSLSLAPREGFFSSEVSDARLSLEFNDKWTLHQFINHRELGTGVGLSQVLDPDGKESVTYYSADLRYVSQINKGEFEGRFTYNYLDMTYSDLGILPAGTSGGALPNGAIQKEYSKSGNDIFAEALYRVVAGRNTFDIGVGGSYGTIKNESDIRNYVLNPGERTPTPIGEFAEFRTVDPLFGDDYSISKVHLMFRDEFRISNDWYFNAGGRIDYSSDIGTHLIPRVGIDWKAGQYTNVGLLYGESVQAPSQVTQTSQGLYFAQGDSDLEPEKIQLLELSFDHAFNDKLSFATNIYTFMLKDTIAIISDPNAANGNSFTNLSGDEKGTGAEVSIKWNVARKTLASLGISSVDVSSDDLSIATSPRLEAYIELNHEFNSGLVSNFAIISVGDRKRRAGNDNAPLKDYAILNASFTKKRLFASDLDFSLSVQNVFDADAREDISTNIPFDLPVYPRRILAGVTYRYD